MLELPALGKDLASYPQPLALEDPPSLAYCDSRSILSALLLASALLQGNG